MTNNIPDYRRLYTDILLKKGLHHHKECLLILKKENLSTLDILSLNDLIFNTNCKETEAFNQKHKSYNEDAIVKILEYQLVNNLNNSQLAAHFKLSRNTITKWKKLYKK
ncbi:transposase [Chryseobacterium angstadtii]|uniref:Transposase n=1 Tax=Chryseobacterium angstadtii TaxID=558151 RepID=A0A0J7KWM8_9FLAO|nr:transposase [Chryseobacterium angstadtii]KMQ61505.1 transposase [Chryseobacterium angstadtii]